MNDKLLLSPQAQRESSSSHAMVGDKVPFGEPDKLNLGSARGAPDIIRAITMSSQ